MALCTCSNFVLYVRCVIYCNDPVPKFAVGIGMGMTRPPPPTSSYTSSSLVVCRRRCAGAHIRSLCSSGIKALDITSSKILEGTKVDVVRKFGRLGSCPGVSEGTQEILDPITLFLV